MARRIGLLSVSMAALGLAVTGYFVQGAGAGSAPVHVADFGVSPADLAQASGDEYETLAQDSPLLHPTTATSATPACAEGSDLSVVTVTGELAILCKGAEVLGYLVTADGETKLVDSIQPKEECSSEQDEPAPDA
jgi:hypothetical protein